MKWFQVNSDILQAGKVKYYIVRIIAGLLFMGSFGCGMLAGAEYGKWIGWPIFISMATIGIILHRIADKINPQH